MILLLYETDAKSVTAHFLRETSPGGIKALSAGENKHAAHADILRGGGCMCTAIAYKTKDRYFGRNLDVDRGYGETVTVMPRGFELRFRREGIMKSHYALIGAAYVADGYPLYYDAVNEKGLCMAGLSFPGNAYYFGCAEGAHNVSPFELIPWVICRCANVREARELLRDTNIAEINFSDELPLHPLHWIISGHDGTIAVESVRDGLMIYDDPVEVLTNNPEFGFHMRNLSNYMNLTSARPVNRFSGTLELEAYSAGMGAVGLPGDLSSASRFVRAAFVKWNSVAGTSEEESVSQFFHILSSVEQQRGCSRTEGGWETTLYSSCCNADRGIYYYRTYRSSTVFGIDMNREDLDGQRLVSYPMYEDNGIVIRN